MLSTRLVDGRKAFPTMKLRRLNWIFSDLLRKWLKRYFEWSARLKGQRFYCRALGGESEYNMTINCDLTVSCNCQDYDGSGHIGDLNKNSFKDVFFGPVARHFREELAKGKLPIMTCTRCGDLERVPKSQSRAVTGVPGGVARAASGTETDPDGQIFAGPMPRLPHRGMLLENTVRCNIDCIGCDRQSAARIRTTTQMDLDKLSRMADLARTWAGIIVLSEPGGTIPFAEHRRGTAAVAQEEPGLPDRDFDEWNRSQLGGQARGGAQREPYLFLNRWRE